MHKHFVMLLGAALFLEYVVQAQIPPLISYQGRIAVSGVNFDGAGQFKFSLVNSNATVTFWSNDGAGSNGGEPAAAVSLTVSKGLYTVLLGDTSLPNMVVIPGSVFNANDLRLRVWFNDGVHGFQQLSPDQRLTAAPFAMRAALADSLAPNAITPANIPNGAITADKLAPGVLPSPSGTVSGFVSEGTNDVSTAMVLIPGLSLSAYVGPQTTSGYPYQLLSVPAGTNTMTARLTSGRTESTQMVLTAGQTLSNVNFRFLRTYYRDADGDGYGDPLTVTNSALPPGAGWVTIGGDFDDNCATCYPGAPEICDGKDNNGNGQIDEGFNLQADVSNCGSCGHICSSVNGTASCNNGACGITCAAGWGNCDGNVNNGCEANINASLNNCGSCGYACSSVNGTPSCVSGACNIICNTGFGNCDGLAINGCETSLNTSVNNCGSCGHVCSSANGTASCVSGQCQIVCNAGYGNCDGNVNNGCETSLATSVNNCGSCGHLCSSVNGAPSCVSGACQIACNAGWGNCDGNANNGCEVNLNTSVNNCGSCGYVCSAVNGTPSCASGQCQIVCNAGWGNCDGNANNGCEVNLFTSVNNCGTCGYVCSSANGTASCASGQCQIACNAGWGNCDGNVNNGCETSLNTSVDNCGTCGYVCSSNHGTPSCSAGICAISCDPGWGNCDGLVSTGCERNLTNDPLNCGTCGRVCGSGSTCVNSLCTPLNDNRANAISIPLNSSETTVSGTLTNSTHDGPSVPCGCTLGGNVWYTFTLFIPSVVYLDTAGSSLDTSLLLTDSSGNPLPAQPGNGQGNSGLCNDDAGCGIAGGFTSPYESRTWGYLNPGSYYVAVGGCSVGAFTLHVQQMPTSVASFFYNTRLSGNASVPASLVGASARSSGLCGGTASGEDARWFIACGVETTFFSICPSDGGTWTRRIGTMNYDPDIYILSAQTGVEVTCNDDGSGAGVDCSGTGGDASQYGSRLPNTTVPRGLNAIFVDERVGGPGMQYTLRYTTPN